MGAKEGCSSHASRLEQLLRKVADEGDGEAAAVILLEELQQIHAELLEDEAEMVLVDKVVIHLDHQRARVRCVFLGAVRVNLLYCARNAQPLKHLNLQFGLFEERRPVANHLDRVHPVATGLDLQHLPEGATPQMLEHLEGLPCGRDNLVARRHYEVTQFVVKATARCYSGRNDSAGVCGGIHTGLHKFGDTAHPFAAGFEG